MLLSLYSDLDQYEKKCYFYNDYESFLLSPFLIVSFYKEIRFNRTFLKLLNLLNFWRNI